MHFFFLEESRNSQFENEADGKTKVDNIADLWIHPLSIKLLIYVVFCEEITLHIYNINGLRLYLPLDIHRYVI